MHKTANVSLTIATGVAGAIAFAALGVPAGSLIGATVAVAALGMATGIGAVPDWLRNMAFTVIGVSLGSGIDASALSHIGDWALSLSLLTVSLIVTLALGAAILRRFFGFAAKDAVLATSPGTMSNAIAMAIESKGDVTGVMALQVMRLLVLVMLVPPFASLLDVTPAVVAPAAVMAALPLVSLLVMAYGAGILGQRIHLPAACLLAGLVISAIGHGSDLLHGTVPPALVFAGFAVTGATLGTRITKVGLSTLSRVLKAGATVTCVTMVTSMGFAVLTAWLSGLPLAMVWIAFAPGGVEAMAAIGLSLGYDPAFVALHHFVRILLLVALVPLAMQVAARRGH